MLWLKSHMGAFMLQLAEQVLEFEQVSADFAHVNHVEARTHLKDLGHHHHGASPPVALHADFEVAGHGGGDSEADSNGALLQGSHNISR